MPVKLALSTTFAAAVLVACSSGSAPSPMQYSVQLGTATLTDLAREVRESLIRNQYELETEQAESPTYVLFQTYWRTRFPLRDEVDSGFTQVRTRITVRARQRTRPGSGAPALVAATLTAENLARGSGEEEWRPGIITPMFRDYVDDIATRLRQELEKGIRVY